MGVEVDTQAPNQPSSAPDMTDESDTGDSNTDDTTAENRPEFNLTCSESNSTVILYVDYSLC